MKPAPPASGSAEQIWILEGSNRLPADFRDGLAGTCHAALGPASRPLVYSGQVLAGPLPAESQKNGVPPRKVPTRCRATVAAAANRSGQALVRHPRGGRETGALVT